MRHSNQEFIHFIRLFLILSLVLSACQSVSSTPDNAPATAKTTVEDDSQQADDAARQKIEAEGYIVVAPDRGFMGNQEIRELFAEFATPDESLRTRHAELVFVTEAQKTRERLASALESLEKQGVERVSILPLFTALNHPKLMLVHEQLEQILTDKEIPVAVSRPLSESYLGVELLGDQFRQIEDPQNTHIVVIGHGAANRENQQAMTRDYEHLIELAATDFGFASTRAIIWPDHGAADKSLMAEAIAALKTAADDSSQSLDEDENSSAHHPKKLAIIPFHLGMKLDGMMSFDAMLGGALPPGAQLVTTGPMPNPLVGMWLEREANRFAQLDDDEVGVVVLAHGANYDWNEAMRDAVRRLEERYMMEYAFSMADRDVIKGAIRRLEARGARAVVIVRIFGLASSFQSTVERLIGQDIEGHQPTAHADTMVEMHGVEDDEPRTDHHAKSNTSSDTPQGARHRDNPHAAGHGHGDAHSHGHGHGHHSSPTPRIRTSAITTTLGGLEDHAIFARALADRLNDLSDDPARETVIIVAHGMGSDAENNHWLGILQSLADQIQQESGADFRAFHIGTWREDWPTKRAEWVPKIRDWVQEASRDGGRAIIIPARTNGQGPAAELLDGLDFALGSGFAPHPLFADWFEDQIRRGIDELNAHTPSNHAVDGSIDKEPARASK